MIEEDTCDTSHGIYEKRCVGEEELKGVIDRVRWDHSFACERAKRRLEERHKRNPFLDFGRVFNSSLEGAANHIYESFAFSASETC